MKYALLLIIFTTLNLNSHSQCIKTIDVSTKQKIQNVKLSISGVLLEYISDSTSNYLPNETQYSDQLITFSAIGYKSTSKYFSDLEEDSFVVYLEPLVFEIDEIVITASRWVQDLKKISNSITKLKIEDTYLLNPQTSADLLSSSANVFVQKSQQAGGSPIIRGFATSRLLYIVDGIRMNNSIFREGNIQNVINIDPLTISNTEVLLGVASTMYGSDALGGVMNFNTLKPIFSSTKNPLIKSNSLIRTSSANKEKTGHIDISLGWKKLAFVTSISKFQFDNLKQGKFGPSDYDKNYFVQRINGVDSIIYQPDPLIQIPSSYSQYNLMQKVALKPNNNWQIDYSFHYSKTSSYGRYDRHNRVKHNLPQYAVWDYGPQKWLMNNVRINYSNSNLFFDKFRLSVARQFFQESRITRNFKDIWRSTNTEKVNAFSYNLDFNKKLNQKSTFFYGTEFIVNKNESTGIIENIESNKILQGATRYPDSKWSSFAIYVNGNSSIKNHIFLNFGIRYNTFSLFSDFEKNTSFYPLQTSSSYLRNSATTAQLGLTYQFNNSFIKSNLGTGFRAPNVDDIGKIFDSEPNSVTVPNPNQKAEYSYNADISYIIKNNHFYFNISGYYTLLKNAMVRQDYTINGQDSIIYNGILSKVQAIQNSAKADIWGIESSIGFNISKSFKFTTNFNYQKGYTLLSYSEKTPFRHIVPTYGKINFEFNHYKFKAVLNSNFQFEMSNNCMPIEEVNKDEIYAKDVNGNNYAPAWYTLNIKFQYAPTNQLKINWGVDNLLNKKYRPFSSGISAAGRNLFISLVFNYI